MQTPMLWVLFALLAFAFSPNVAGKSHSAPHVFARRADFQARSHDFSNERPQLWNGNHRTNVEGAYRATNVTLGNGKYTLVVDPEVDVPSELHPATLAERHKSEPFKSEASASGNDISEELDDSQEEDGVRGSPRGLLAYFLQSFIRNTIKTTTIAAPTTAKPTEDTYSYATKDMWPTLFPEHCAGRRQSPININRLTVMYSVDLNQKPLEFINYDAIPFNQLAVNNGHSLQVTQNPEASRIQEGGLAESYTLAQYHFHWGKVSSRGSEHTIDSVRYPIELHLVHYKTSHGSLANSLNDPNGIVVLAVLFELSTRDNPALNPIVEQISHDGEDATMSGPYPPSSLLPLNPTEFYAYDGSLTTPPCNEVVKFLVFKETQFISEEQLERFRSLKDSHGEPLVDNFRNTQPLNGRQVFRSFQ